MKKDASQQEKAYLPEGFVNHHDLALYVRDTIEEFEWAFTPWEIAFIHDVEHRYYLSPRQHAIIDELWEKSVSVRCSGRDV